LKKKTMRLVLCLVLLVAMLATGMPAMASPRAAASETLIIDGKTASVPVTVVGRASLVQVRALAETFGTVPQWDNKEKIASFTAAGKNIQVFAGQGRVAVDGKEMKAATRILRGRVFVELAPMQGVLGITKAARTIASGTFTGEARGYGGMLRVEVKTADNKITAVRVVEQRETPGIADPALTRIPQAIVSQQSIAIDGITGATMTSKAILDAVAQAIGKARANVSEWRLRPAAAAPVAPGQPAAVRKQTDVVVIGGGGAGLAAAVSAAEAGAKVILIEKMPALGGNTIRSGGAYQAVNPELQRRQNIEDSLDLHFQHTFEGGDRQGNQALIRILVNNALDGIRWLEGYGMKWRGEVTAIAGSLWRRVNMPVEPVGTGYINALQRAASQRGVEIMLETKAERLIVRDGRVVGVEATSKGGTVTLEARRGVVLATGGFGANKEMMAKYRPAKKDLPTTNHPGATGDGIIMAEAIGARLIGMEHVQSLPLGDPKTGSLSGWAGGDVANYIFVNRDGRRFVDEGARRDVMVNALLQQRDQLLFLITDANSAQPGSFNHFNERIEDLVARGSVFTDMTIEGLARQIGVDPAVLRTTIETYNQAVAQKSDREFGKTLLGVQLNKPPFFASPRKPTIHHTMGGVEINERTQVIDRNGRVIPGLFAAGEVTGGIHGTNRLGANALADIIVFGRIAGKSAAESR